MTDKEITTRVCQNVMQYAKDHGLIDELRVEMQGSFSKVSKLEYNFTIKKLARIAKRFDIDDDMLAVFFD